MTQRRSSCHSTHQRKSAFSQVALVTCWSISLLHWSRFCNVALKLEHLQSRWGGILIDAILECYAWHLTWTGSSIWPTRKCTVDTLGYDEDPGTADATGWPHTPAPRAGCTPPTTLGANSGGKEHRKTCTYICRQSAHRHRACGHQRNWATYSG